MLSSPELGPNNVAVRAMLAACIGGQYSAISVVVPRVSTVHDLKRALLIELEHKRRIKGLRPINFVITLPTPSGDVTAVAETVLFSRARLNTIFPKESRGVTVAMRERVPRDKNEATRAVCRVFFPRRLGLGFDIFHEDPETLLLHLKKTALEKRQFFQKSAEFRIELWASETRSGKGSQLTGGEDVPLHLLSAQHQGRFLGLNLRIVDLEAPDALSNYNSILPTHTGYLKKQSDVLRVWRDRFVTLSQVGLAFYSSSKMTSNTKPRSTLALQALKTLRVLDNSCRFELLVAKTTILFEAKDAGECSVWVRAIAERARHAPVSTDKTIDRHRNRLNSSLSRKVSIASEDLAKDDVLYLWNSHQVLGAWKKYRFDLQKKTSLVFFRPGDNSEMPAGTLDLREFISCKLTTGGTKLELKRGGRKGNNISMKATTKAQAERWAVRISAAIPKTTKDAPPKGKHVCFYHNGKLFVGTEYRCKPDNDIASLVPDAELWISTKPHHHHHHRPANDSTPPSPPSTLGPTATTAAPSTSHPTHPVNPTKSSPPRMSVSVGSRGSRASVSSRALAASNTVRALVDHTGQHGTAWLSAKGISYRLVVPPGDGGRGWQCSGCGVLCTGGQRSCAACHTPRYASDTAEKKNQAQKRQVLMSKLLEGGASLMTRHQSAEDPLMQHKEPVSRRLKFVDSSSALLPPSGLGAPGLAATGITSQTRGLDTPAGFANLPVQAFLQVLFFCGERERQWIPILCVASANAVKQLLGMYQDDEASDSSSSAASSESEGEGDTDSQTDSDSDYEGDDTEGTGERVRRAVGRRGARVSGSVRGEEEEGGVPEYAGWCQGDPHVPLVFDNGEHSLKAGFAWQSIPRVTVACRMAHPTKRAPWRRALVGGEFLRNLVDTPEQVGRINPTVFSDSPTNWSDVELSWMYALEHLQADPTQHPMLMSVPLDAPVRLKDTMTEIALETLGCPAVYLASAPLLPLYAAEEQGLVPRTHTALLVDVGHSGCQIAALSEGRLLQSARGRHLGGRAMGTQMQLRLKDRMPLSFPPWKTAPPIFVSDYLNESVSRDICKRLTYATPDKETYLTVRVDKDSMTSSGMRHTYNVPWETSGAPPLSLCYELLDVGEYLFQPMAIMNDFESTFVSIQDMILSVLAKCPTSSRQDLVSNVVISGGVTLLRGFAPRLTHELKTALPGLSRHVSLKVPGWRGHGVWKGGAALSNLASFQEKWLFAADYAEQGQRTHGAFD